MRRSILLFATYVLPFVMMGQTSSSDCVGATILCGDVYSEENAPPGTGNIYEYTGACNQNLETMSLWYTFTVYETGMLSFILTPNILADDYDWGLFNITNGGCEGIAPGGSSPEVSCNSWGSLSVPNGATGISTAMGGVSNVGGPGDQFGPPFNANLPVSVGQTYALVVMNWSNSSNGYTINFSESTASLYDNVPPSPILLTTNCDHTQFVVTFSETVISSSAENLDFVITGPQGDVSISNVVPLNPLAVMEDQFIIIPTQQILISGTYTLNITDLSGSVVDACGNPNLGEISVELEEILQATTLISTACNGSGGTIEITNVSGGVGDYTFLLNNVIQPDFVAENLSPASYAVVVQDEANCSIVSQAVVPDHLITVSIGAQDTINCDIQQIQIQGVVVSPIQEVNYSWDYLTQNAFVNTGETTPDPTFNASGVYQLTITNPANGCSAQGMTAIVASEINNLNFDVSIIADCNNLGGSIEIIDESGGYPPYEFHLNGELQNNNFYQDLNGGIYDVSISDSHGCSFVQIVDIPLVNMSVNIPVQDSLQCNSTEIIIQGVVLIPNEPSNFSWTVFTTQGFVNTSFNNISPVINTAGIYALVVTNSANGCQATDTVEIFTNIPDNFSFEYVTNEACNGVGGSIEITTIQQGSAPFVISVNGDVQNELLADSLFDGNYFIELMDANSCVASANVLVSNHLLNVQIPAQPSLTCDIPSINISGIIIQPTQPVTYNWAVLTANQFVPLGIITSTLSVNTSGTYQVMVSNEGCTDTATVAINYSNANNVAFETAITAACNGTDGVIEINTITGGTSPYVFALNGLPQPSTTTSALSNGSYNITITDAHNCIQTTQVNIPNNLLFVVVPEQDRVSCRFPTVQVQGVLVTPSQPVTYNWSLYNGNTFLPVSAEGIAPFLSSAGTYRLTVTSTETGCTAYTNFVIEPGDLVSVDLDRMKFPNVITANKDSKNDDWMPFLDYDSSIDLLEVFDLYELHIFNRWGNLIYDNNGKDSRRWSIKEEEAGTYFFTLVYSTACGGVQKGSRQGTIQLLR